MSQSATLNGDVYTIPTTGDTGWGSELTSYLVAISTTTLQKNGGSFTLSADADFGATYGLKAAYFKTQTANLSTAGVLRLARADTIGWRNQANGANLALGVDTSNNLTWESVPVVTTTGTQTLTGKTLTSPKLNEDVAVTTTATKLNYLTSAGGTTGTTSTNLVFSTSPTLVTPTLGVATATSINKVAITAPATGATLTLADGSTLATSGAYSVTLTATGATTLTLPTAGTLATLAGAESLSAKTLVTPIIDDYAEINEESAPSAPAAGKVRLYAKTDKKLYTKDSAGTETQVGAGGSGELNLIDNPSDSNNWTETGTRFNGYPTTTTTSGDLPLEGTVATAIQIISSTTVAGDETTDYVSYPFTTGAAQGQKMKVEFYMRPGSNFVASEWTVSVWDTAGPTRQALSTDSSSLTYLPNATGKFTTTFDAAASTSYTLRFTRRVAGAASAATLNLANVIVGPGIQPQGAVVGEWVAFTPTGAWSTNTTYTGFYRRIGDSAEIQYKLALSGAPTSANLTVNLPTGLTIDSSKMADTTGGVNPVGQVVIYDASAAASANVKHGAALYSTTSVIAVNTYSPTNDDYSSVTQASPVTFASGDIINISVRVPIAEWAGSGTVNVAQNDVEYASNSNSTSSDNTTAFAYGPGGSDIPSITASGVATQVQKRVSFPTAFQSGEYPLVLVQLAGTGIWTPIGTSIDYPAEILQNTGAAARHYGICCRRVSGSSTDVDVFFGGAGRTPSGTSYGATGSNFPANSGDKYVVVKTKAGQAIGFGLATTGGTAGLVNPYGTSGVVYAGTYTPTLAGAVNCSSLVLTSAQYQRVGKIVTVTAKGTLTVTTTATDTAFSMTLPVTTANFASVNQAIGVGALVRSATNIRDAGYVRSTSGAQTAELVVESTSAGTGATSCEFFVSFTYEIQ